jgi:hypothetical protein
MEPETSMRKTEIARRTLIALDLPPLDPNPHKTVLRVPWTGCSLERRGECLTSFRLWIIVTEIVDQFFDAHRSFGGRCSRIQKISARLRNWRCPHRWRRSRVVPTDVEKGIIAYRVVRFRVAHGLLLLQ